MKGGPSRGGDLLHGRPAPAPRRRPFPGRVRGGCAGVLLLAACLAPAAAAERWIDLTHAFGADTIFWPTEQGFRLDAGNNGVNAKGYYYAANRFATAEHGGTHLDAPRHFSAEGQTSDRIPVDRFVGDAAVVDVSDAVAVGVSAWDRSCRASTNAEVAGSGAKPPPKGPSLLLAYATAPISSSASYEMSSPR